MSVIQIAEGAHSELGPSSADRWLNCPGSVIASRGKPDNPTQYAIEGTAAHTHSQWAREQNKKARDFKGITIRVEHTGGPTDVLVDDDMVNATQEFIDRINSKPGIKLIEERVHYGRFVPGGFGTLDGAAFNDDLAHIMDYKYGEGVRKEPKMLEQLMTYGVGLMHDWDWLFNFDKFVLSICQPRLDHYDEWETTGKFLYEWAGDVLVPGAKLALSEGAPFKAGEWCQFCRIKATCRERRDSLARAVLHDEKAALAGEAIEAAEKRIAELSNDEIFETLLALGSLASYRSALEEHAYREVDQGRAVGDLKIVAGRSSRGYALKAPEVIENILAFATENELPVTYSDLHTEPELISLPQAEKILPRGVFDTAKEATAKKPAQPAGPLAHLMLKSQGKPTLVRGSDTRPSLKETRVSEEAAALLNEV